jgi:hypothetical protein
MQKQLISLYKASQKTVAGIALFLLFPLYTHAASASIQELLTNASFFIKLVLVPVLFGIAFLFFLINMMKYFVIGGANEEARAKGRKNLLYSLAAFVFLISIWSIVTLLITGIGIEETDSLCPDYMKAFNKNCGDIGNGQGSSGGFGSVSFPGGGNSTGDGDVGSYAGNTTGDGGGTEGSTPGGGDGGSAGGNVGGNSNFAGLAELVFGTGKDSALFTQNEGGPRAIYQTPSIAATASCTSGLNTLLLANTVETSQAAYALYKDSTGATRWQNITDLHSANHITYDKDMLDTLVSSAGGSVHVIHTHPNTRTENLDLTMGGHGPSSADMKAMCTNNSTALTYAVVDATGIWTVEQQADTCPYSVSAKNTLPILETYIALASVEASTRPAELVKYTDAAITPTQYKEHFTNIDTQALTSYAPEEVLALSDTYQTYASTSVTYSRTVDAFCNTF